MTWKLLDDCVFSDQCPFRTKHHHNKNHHQHQQQGQEPQAARLAVA